MRQAQTLTDAQLRRVLHYCRSRRHPLRDEAIILTSFYAGLRAIEVAALKYADVYDEQGTEAFQFAAILPLMAAVDYATLHMLTRYIGRTESAAAMSFYIQITFIFVSILFGLILGDGRYSGGSDPSLEFLFREWSWPVLTDYYILLAIGAASALGGFFISQAYRVSEAAFVAPFEYIALPMAIVWGILVFGEWPDIVSYLGIALILGSGLYMIWRETKAAMQQVPDTPRYRR